MMRIHKSPSNGQACGAQVASEDSRERPGNTSVHKQKVHRQNYRAHVPPDSTKNPGLNGELTEGRMMRNMKHANHARLEGNAALL